MGTGSGHYHSNCKQETTNGRPARCWQFGRRKCIMIVPTTNSRWRWSSKKQFRLSPLDVAYADYATSERLPVANGGTTHEISRKFTHDREVALELFKSSEMRSLVTIQIKTWRMVRKQHKMLANTHLMFFSSMLVILVTMWSIFCWVLNSYLVLSPTTLLMILWVARTVYFELFLQTWSCDLLVESSWKEKENDTKIEFLSSFLAKLSRFED